MGVTGFGSGILTGVPEKQGVIDIAADLRLRSFGGEADVDAAWPWYRDVATVRLVDGPDGSPYSRRQVRDMYRALSSQGEVYMIERRDGDDPWEVVGDVTLAPHTLPIVLRPDWRGRGIGRRVLVALIARARELGWVELHARSIDAGNTASAALFTSVGFERCSAPPPDMSLRLD